MVEYALQYFLEIKSNQIRCWPVLERGEGKTGIPEKNLSEQSREPGPHW